MAGIDSIRKSWGSEYDHLSDYQIADYLAQATGRNPERVWADLGIAPQDKPGFKTTVDRSAGQFVQSIGQLADDAGWDNNPIERYGQSVVDRNPSGINSLEDIKNNPGLAVREAAGNAAFFLLPAGAAGVGLKAMGAGRLAMGAAQTGIAALPSYGGIRQNQLEAGHDEPKDMLVAGAGALGVGYIEQRFGLNKMLGLSSAPKAIGERAAVREFASSPWRTGLKEWAKTGLVEGGEELAQNPIEQASAYQDPTTSANLQDTAFSGAMGTLGGLSLGGLGGVQHGMHHRGIASELQNQGYLGDTTRPTDILNAMSERDYQNYVSPIHQDALDYNTMHDGGLPPDIAEYLNQQQGPEFDARLPAGNTKEDMEAALNEPVGTVGDRTITAWDQFKAEHPDLFGKKQAAAPVEAPAAATPDSAGHVLLTAAGIKHTDKRVDLANKLVDLQAKGVLDDETVQYNVGLLGEYKQHKNVVATIKDAENALKLQNQNQQPQEQSSAQGTVPQAGQPNNVGVQGPAAPDTQANQAQSQIVPRIPPPPKPTTAEGLPRYKELVSQWLTSRLEPGELKALEVTQNADKESSGDPELGASSLRVAAKQLGVSHETVRNRANRALEKIDAAARVAGFDLDTAKEILGMESSFDVMDQPSISVAEAAQAGLNFAGASKTKLAPQIDEEDTSVSDRGQQLGEEGNLVGSFGDAQEFDEGTRGETKAADVDAEEASAEMNVDVKESAVGHAGLPIRPVDVDDAISSWEDLDGTTLPKQLHMGWTKLWVTHQDGVIDDHLYYEKYLDYAKQADNIRSIQEEAGSAKPQPDAGVSPETGGKESPAKSPSINPVEQRVADLHAKLNDKQRKSLDKLVNRYKDGDIDLERLNTEIDALEERAKPQLSKTDAKGGTSREAIFDVVEQLTGKRSNWRVTTFDTVDEANAAGIKGVTFSSGDQAFVVGNKAYFILSNIPKGSELAVFLHEVGAHIGIENLLNDSQYKNLVSKIFEWAKRADGSIESQVARATMDRMQQAGLFNEDANEADLAPESIAYFIEEAVKHGVDPTAAKYNGEFARMVRSIWAAFKNALRRLGIANLDKLSAQDVVDLAYGAARLELGSKWHGTAAEFRKFDHSYMGTGEGAQAYGWGTYLAERKGTAKGYFEADTRRKYQNQNDKLTFADGSPMTDATRASISLLGYKAGSFYGNITNKLNPNWRELATKYLAHAEEVMSKVEQADRDYKAAVEAHQEKIRGLMQQLRIAEPSAYKAIRRTLDKEIGNYPQYATTPFEYFNVKGDVALLKEILAKGIQIGGGKAQGSLMATDHTVAPDEMLDWFKPLGEQSEKVKAALKNVRTFLEMNGDLSDLEDAKNAEFDEWTAKEFVRQILPKIIENDALPTNPEVPGSTTAAVDKAAEQGNFDKAASLYLDSIGIKGIKFLDQQSRNKTVTSVKKLEEDLARKRRIAVEEQARLDDLLAKKAHPASIKSAKIIVGSVTDAIKFLEQELSQRRAADQSVSYNHVIFNDKNLIRVKTEVGANPENIRFSKAAVEKVVDALPKEAQEPARVLATNLNDYLKKATYALSFGHDLADMIAKVLPTAKEYFDLMGKKAATRTHLESQIDKIMEQVSSVKDKSALSSFLKESTKDQKWGFVPDWKQNVTVDAAMKQKFDALSGSSQDAAKIIFKHGFDSMAQLRELVKTEIEESYADDPEMSPKDKKKHEARKLRAMKLFNDRFSEMQGPYAPLSRFGNYVLVAKSARYMNASEDEKAKLESDGKHYHVEFFESLGEAEQAKRRMATDFTGGQITASEKQAMYRTMEAPWQAMKRLQTMIKDSPGMDGKDKMMRQVNTLLNDLYLSTLAETSARQYQNRRRNIEGSSDDMLRAFASKGRADAHFISSLQYSGDVNNALAAMRSEAKPGDDTQAERVRALNEVLARHAASMEYKDTPMQDRLASVTSFWMLLTNPAYYLQNSTQPFMMTLPWMAGRHGYAKSWGALTKAYGDIKKGGMNIDKMPITPAERKMLNDLKDMGILDIGINRELGHWTAADSKSKAAKLFGTVNFKLQTAVQNVEQLNRISSALAAYRLSNGSTDEAARALRVTHGDYSAFNAPRAFNLPGAKLLLQFRKFQLIQLSMLIRLVHTSFKGADATERAAARKAFGFLLGHHFAMAGALGMPAMNLIGYALASAFGDDDDPKDLEYLLGREIDDESLRALLLKGAPAALGMDVSRKLGMGTTTSLVPFVNSDPFTKQGYADTVLGLSGPFISGVGASIADGVGQIRSGNVYKGMEQMLPSGLRQAMRGYRTATEGITTRNNDVVMTPDELTFLDGLMQGVGLPSTTVTAYQNKRGTTLSSSSTFLIALPRSNASTKKRIRMETARNLRNSALTGKTCRKPRRATRSIQAVLVRTSRSSRCRIC